MPKPKPGGRPAKYSRREVVNGILYQTRNGGGWRALPHDLSPYWIVFHYFRAWQKDGTWDRIHDALREKTRRHAGKKPKPTAVILDSQSVKTTAQGGRRGEKKITAASVLNRSRRLRKDYERTVESSEAFVKVAMIYLMTRRLR